MLITRVLMAFAGLNCLQAVKENSQLFILLRHFFNKLKFPMKINAYLCWDTASLIHFEREMFKDNYMVHILNNKFESVRYYLPEEHQMFLVDLKCNNAYDLLSNANGFPLFKQPFRWVVIGKLEELISYDFYIKLDSKFYVITETADENYKISTIYKHSRNSLYTENITALWRKDLGFEYFNNLCIPRGRRNLDNMEMLIPYVATSPDTPKHLDDYRHKHIDPIAKVNYKLVNHLVDFINITPKWIARPTWGYRNTTTGLYSGMIGDLQNGSSSIGGTPCFFTEDRIDIIDFIAATTPTFMKFIFRAPPLSFVTNVFTLPFDSHVWYCCFTMVAIIAVTTYVIVFWEWKDPIFRAKIDDKNTALRPKMLDVALMEIGAITQQGTDVEPKSGAGRIVTIFTFLVLMFLYTSYSANIVALLQSTTDSIRTLEDLLNSRIKLGVEDIVYAHYYFENAKEPVRKAIYEHKIAPKGEKPSFMTLEEGIARMKDEFFGFHVEVAKGYKVVSDIFQEHEKCGLKEVEYVNLVEPWLATKKNSSYKEIFKAGMRRIHESGLQRREVNRIYTRKPICHNKGSNFVSVGLIDCYYAFVMFGVGVFLCILILFFEIMLQRYETHVENKKKIVKTLSDQQIE